MDLKDKIGFAFVLSVFSIIIAGLFPSAYSLTFSAVVTTLAIISLAIFILKDDQKP